MVLVYSEKHATIAGLVGLAGPPRLRAIGEHWRVDADLVLHAGGSSGLIERLQLPALERHSPLPRASADHPTLGIYRQSPPRVHAPAELWRRIAARLPAMPAPLAELLIGALAHRFWDDRPGPAATYDALDRRRWNPPTWLPFYWFQACSRADARALLAHIDAVAARPAVDFGPEDAAAELACRHLADCCRRLAAACRVGHLPETTSCYFWREWSQEAFAASRALFPPECGPHTRPCAREPTRSMNAPADPEHRPKNNVWITACAANPRAQSRHGGDYWGLQPSAISVDLARPLA